MILKRYLLGWITDRLFVNSCRNLPLDGYNKRCSRAASDNPTTRRSIHKDHDGAAVEAASARHLKGQRDGNANDGESHRDGKQVNFLSGSGVFPFLYWLTLCALGIIVFST